MRDEVKPREKGAGMSSVLRSVRKRKKSRRLGEVEIISREGYEEFELDAKVEAIRALIPLGLMHVKELLDQEVRSWRGSVSPARRQRFAGGVTAATLVRSALRGSGLRSGFRGCAAWQGARYRCDPTKRSAAITRRTIGC